LAQPTVYVVSDSLGETAELVARAAASQFGERFAIRRVPHVDDAAAVMDVVAEARESGAAIVFTLIRPELRELMRREAERAGLPAVDLMGPALDALATVAGTSPRLQPGLMHRLDEDYFRRVEAVEFAVKYDDGRDPRGLLRADVVLTGVSRTSKTPVSMYLAHRKYRVANVPLVPEVEPPAELFQVPVQKVVGLTIRAEKLREIRQERLRAIGLGADAPYGDMQRIREELAFAHDVFRRLGCPVIDVSDKAVEETADRVLEIVFGRDTA
jgi:regulator of PEP synthase PpsR (kinase-PPPase family)